MTTRSAPIRPAHGGEQDGLQIGAMERELRRRMAGPMAERLLVDELPEAVEERRFARDHRDALELGKDAERLQRRRRVRQDVDADAERPHLGRSLEHAAGDALPVQGQRERQAADAGADDRDLVAPTRCAKFGHDRDSG
jgi:hypothetical protein